MKDQIVVEELTRIKQKHGKLQAKAVVDESRPEDAPLHGNFEWNDGVAGENWRVFQARQLIRTVKIENPATQQQYHAFVHIGNRGETKQGDEISREGYYECAEIVARDVDLFARALSEIQRKISGLQDSADELRRLASGEIPEQAALIEALVNSLHVAESITRKIPH